MSADVPPDRALATAQGEALADVRLIDPRDLRWLVEPQRAYLVHATVDRAKGARALAAELGCPVTRLYHHLKALVDKGFLVVERIIPGRGGGERLYRATARRLLLDRSTFATPAAGDALESVLSFVFDRARLDILEAVQAGVVDLQRRAPDPKSLVAWRNVLRLAPADATRLYREIDALWQAYDTAPARTPGEARMYSFAVALCPLASADTRPDTDD